MFKPLTYVPTKQRTAREQQAAGVVLPYWVEDLDGPNNYHIKLTILQPDDIDRLVLFCRSYAAEYITNEYDNRTSLDYPVNDRERCAFIRHALLNRTDRNTDKVGGYHGSYDNILFRIDKKGVNVAAQQLAFKRHIGALIAEHYPHLRTEVEYWLWQFETNHNRTDHNLFDQGATP